MRTAQRRAKMAEYLSPGVYVEEFSSGSRPIEGVSTSTAGFIGLAQKGPVMGAPELITNFSDFQRKFGGFLSKTRYGEYRYLPLAVEQFFVNGGSRAFVMRVAPPDAKPAAANAGALSLTAGSPGEWGNSVSIVFESASRTKLQFLESFGGGSYRAKATGGVVPGDKVFALSEDGKKEYNSVTKVVDNIVTFEKDFAADIVDTKLVCTNFVYTCEANVSVKWEDDVENYENASLNPASPNYIEKLTSKSRMVKIEVSGELPAEPCGVLQAVAGEDSEKYAVTLQNGADGSMSEVTPATFMGEDNGPGTRTGIQAFLENNHVNIMAVPGITMPEVIVTLVAHCENMSNRFAVLDMPRDVIKTDELIACRNLIDSTYAAFYHPWVQVFERAENKPAYIPPSGSVIGVYARSDSTRGVHKAPANEAVACAGLSCSYNKGEQDILNPAGINLIREFPGQGVRIWGARTASSDPSFKYVNVRRLFIFMEESIRQATNWVVFEPNDEMLWGRVSRTIEGFLTGMWRDGALVGTSPAEAFFVDVGPNTMTSDDINNGRLICVIGAAPSKPAEFVIFRVTQIVDKA